MTNTTQKRRRNFGEVINQWLDEPEDQTFRHGKWRFWFLALVSLSILNAVLTASIFGSNRQGFIGSITLAVGALVAWLCVGTLHYSDSRDARLARGVSLLDSISLCFVITHFCFLLWAQGHLLTIQAQEADYKAAAATFNEKAEKISSDNVKIAEEITKAEKERAKAERLRNDTMYQARRLAEAGGLKRPRDVSAQAGQFPAPSTAPSLAAIELEKPEKPKETSAAFLAKWDAWIRVANFGELILAAVTLIFIRNWTAKTNTPSFVVEDFPDEIDADVIEKRSPSRRGDLAKGPNKETSFLATKKETAKKHASFDSEGLKKLREALRDISFRLAGLSFKSYVRGDAVWILMMKANQGTQETLHSAKAKLSILDDAMTMPREAFKEKLEKFLKENGFTI